MRGSESQGVHKLSCRYRRVFVRWIGNLWVADRNVRYIEGILNLYKFDQFVRKSSSFRDLADFSRF